MAEELKPIKVAFDLGGVISKYPIVFRRIMIALADSSLVVPYVLSDMENRERLIKLLRDNGFHAGIIPDERILQADYKDGGEYCKRNVCEAHGIDLLIDDYPGYIASGNFVRLLVMPDQDNPYFHDEWKDDAPRAQGFGHRPLKPHKSVGKG